MELSDSICIKLCDMSYEQCVSRKLFTPLGCGDMCCYECTYTGNTLTDCREFSEAAKQRYFKFVLLRKKK
jgi:hypothetical protein